MTDRATLVTSVDDPLVADYRNLTDVALRRRLEPELGLFIAEGAAVIRRALAAGYRPRSFLMAQRWVDDLRDVVGDSAPLLVADEPVLTAVTGYRVHRGALAAMHRRPLPAPADVLRDARRVVLLEGIVDHANVGAVFRSAAGLGFDAVLVDASCADPLYRRSVRVSMGTVFAVPWTRLPHWPDDVADLRRAGFVVAALTPSRDAVPLPDLVDAAPDRLVLALGTEGDGLSATAVTAADLAVQIPMAGGVDSLNVGAAAAVACYALRPRTARR
jgi:tRNA G18 (ribose-2'-O)-methylase SpoU